MEFSSSQYWEERYKADGNSGSGSYGRLSTFKIEFLNAFISEHRIESMLDLGCGDGNQIRDLVDVRYVGVDVSETIVKKCEALYGTDSSWSFYVYDNDVWQSQKYALSLSLDVIFHLVEDSVFDQYMHDLFDHATQFVIVYASNYDRNMPFVHVRHRKYMRWCEENLDGWSLKSIILNPFPYESDESSESVSDFYVFEKCADPGFTYQNPAHLLTVKQKEVDVLRGILDRKDARYDAMVVQYRETVADLYEQINTINEQQNKKIQDARDTINRNNDANNKKLREAYDVINRNNAEIKKLKSASYTKK